MQDPASAHAFDAVDGLAAGPGGGPVAAPSPSPAWRLSRAIASNRRLRRRVLAAAVEESNAVAAADERVQ